MNNKNIILGDNDVVFGDPHGCLNSVLELCQKMNFNVDRERLVLAGDIVDKGPQVKELMDVMVTYGWEAIQGNHDEKILRYARGSKIRVNAEIADTVRQLGEGWQDYALRISEWPLYMAFEDSQGSGYVVHGGVSPDRPIQHQSSNNLLRMRTWPFEVYNRDRELTQPLWQESYQGHLGTILHGHMPCESAQFHGNEMVYSLDGGAVYSYDRPWFGCMRGIRLGTREIFEVPGIESNTIHYLSLEQ